MSNPHPNPDGRPSLYKESYNLQAFKLTLLGAVDTELANFFGVCERTLNNWKQENPLFLQSITDGKEKADAEIAQKLYGRAMGAEWYEEQAIKVKVGKDLEEIQIVRVKKAAPPDVSAINSWLTNRRPKQWKNKQDTTISGDKDNPIVTKNADYSGLTDAELAALIGIASKNQPVPQ